MGEVHRAWDCLNAREVALKTLVIERDEIGGSVQELALDELRWLTAVDHPGIVSVHDVGRDSAGRPWLAMDVVEGTRIDQFLIDATDDARRACILALLSTLGWLHQRGLVHGDIKPQNVLVEERAGACWPVLIDFGLARAVGAATVGGTSRYVDPSAGPTLTPRADLFALATLIGDVASDLRRLGRGAVATLQAVSTALSAGDIAAASELLGGTLSPQLGGFAAADVWGPAIHEVVEASAVVARVTVGAVDDVEPLARAITTALALKGGGAWTLVAEPGLGAFVRLADSLGVEAAPTAGYLGDTFLSSVLSALNMRDVPALTWVVAAPERLSATGARVLKRLHEAGVMQRLVLVTATPHALGARVVTPALEVDAKQWDTEDVLALLAAHGVTAPPPEVVDALVARAELGASGLQAQLALWSAQGTVSLAGDGGWAFTGRPELDADGASEGEADRLWKTLWEGLETSERAALSYCAELGGWASQKELDSRLSQPQLARLLSMGALVRDAQPGAVCLSRALARRLNRSEGAQLALPAVSDDGRTALLERCLSAPDERRRARAALVHLRLLGRQSEAVAQAWHVAALAEELLDPADGALALTEGAAAALDDDAPAAALEAALAALARSELAGARGETSERALGLARRAADAVGTNAARLAMGLARGRYLVGKGDCKTATSTAEALRAYGPELARSRPSQLQLALVAGTAAAGVHDTKTARAELETARQLAQRLRDDLALAKVTNNLAILYYNDGDFQLAADAWEAAAHAKARLGDVRGERIGMTNSALAMRELGRLGIARTRIERARELAAQIGDRQGTTMALLSGIQVEHDLGALEPARALMTALDTHLTQWPAGSALVAGDIEIVRLELLWATEAMAASAVAEAAGALAADAVADGRATVARDAAVLAYRAGIAAERQPSEALWSVLEAHASAHVTAPLALVRIYQTAREGAWDAAIDRLRSWLSSPTVTAGAGVVPAAARVMGLAHRTAALVGDADLADEILAMTRACAGLRCELHRQLHAEPLSPTAWCRSVARLDVERIELARVVHDPSTPSEPGQRPVSNVDPKGGLKRRRVEPAMELLTTMWADVANQPTPPTPSDWLAALRTSANAKSTLALSSDGRTVVASSGPIEPARFSDVGREACNGKPFAARTADGRLLALAVPMRPWAGALVVQWAPGSPGSPSYETGLGPIAAAVGLATAEAEARSALVGHQRQLNELELRHRELEMMHRDEVTALRDALTRSQVHTRLAHDYSAIIHESSATRRVLATLDKVTETEIPVLLRGESGVGKELMARALHYNGPRASRPFVAENCGAVPRDLFESVFFGHKKGAFTGAVAPSVGLFESARGGTLFLDEVGELPLEHQVKLLRVLQESRFRPVGAGREVVADVRIVAATNRNLEAMVADGSFREDLYYRLAVVTVDIPPLRERRADVLPLATAFLAQRSERMGRSVTLSQAAADALQAYGWPGNVRELENEMVRASVLCEGAAVKLSHLSPKVRDRHAATPAARTGGARPLGWDGTTTLETALGAVERELLVSALTRLGGKKIAVAKALGLSRPGLDGKLARHGIDAKAIKAALRARKGELR